MREGECHGVDLIGEVGRTILAVHTIDVAYDDLQPAADVFPDQACQWCETTFTPHRRSTKYRNKNCTTAAAKKMSQILVETILEFGHLGGDDLLHRLPRHLVGTGEHPVVVHLRLDDN